jgi:hypothetical protein
MSTTSVSESAAKLGTRKTPAFVVKMLDMKICNLGYNMKIRTEVMKEGGRGWGFKIKSKKIKIMWHGYIQYYYLYSPIAFHSHVFEGHAEKCICNKIQTFPFRKFA